MFLILTVSISSRFLGYSHLFYALAIHYGRFGLVFFWLLFISFHYHFTHYYSLRPEIVAPFDH